MKTQIEILKQGWMSNNYRKMFYQVLDPDENTHFCACE